jgi:antibiotic biosynthesis monooxygenase (ABM) superfamily enzyme
LLAGSEVGGAARESWKISMSYEPISQWKVRIGILVGLIPIGATRVYYVREMLAALIIFSALFALVAAIGLTLFLIWFLLDRARQLELGWMEKRGKGFARAALRVLPVRLRV